ncbi:hypothetical protein [Luteolibacter marinus]|uniref:hypothetical protein n=1 Tax=Luteolibacter marinus TaxID=2776705 RepID=UPI00186762C9|nr:hypothetical protein [Luteolibacter marinus]
MATETLSFCCPHCKVRLTVPSSLAGVTGPCPSCKASITAPLVTTIKTASPPPKSFEVPAPAPAPVPAAGTKAAGGSKIRPEPRKLPERPPTEPIQPRRSTDDDQLRQSIPLAPPADDPRSSRLVHALLPASFSALAVTIVYLLLYFFLPDGPRQRIKQAQRPLDLSAAKPAATSPVFPASPAPAAPPEPTVPAEENVESAETALRPADESPALAANALLEAFLKAPDAASRVGMVEPAATEQELAGTLLARPLPEVAQIFSELPQENPMEQLTEYPYRVSFFAEGQRNIDYAVVVRQRGNQPPKVFLPAFLDLVGGRLDSFVATPNDSDPARFHVILEAVSGCHDKSVPNGDHKFTFKLLPSPFGRETARSYVSVGSRFKAMVEDPSSSLRWGLRIRATVTLQWNHMEDPDHPYLELLDINALSWNP